MVLHVAVALIALMIASGNGQVLNCEDGLVKNLAVPAGEITGRLLYQARVRSTPQEGIRARLTKTYPSNGRPLGKITYIQVLDQKTDGSGGCVKVSGGGIFQQYVSLYFESHPGKSIDSMVKIYGN